MSDTPPVNTDEKPPVGPMIEFRTNAKDGPKRKGQIIDSIEEKDDVLLKFRLDNGNEYFVLQSLITEWEIL